MDSGSCFQVLKRGRAGAGYLHWNFRDFKGMFVAA